VKITFHIIFKIATEKQLG